MDTVEFMLKIGAAIGAGLFIGLEREYKNKNAGIKTNILVSLGAAVFIVMSLNFRGEANVDITRVLSQVVIGIGFLGAGAILKKDNHNIKGLTTAATIWCSAGVGCLAGFGFYLELLILTIAIVLINLIFGIIDSRINSKD